MEETEVLKKSEEEKEKGDVGKYIINNTFIEEEVYQGIKKKMNKTNDYFTKEELEKIGVILA